MNIKQVLEAVAKRDNVSVEDVYRNIQDAIDLAFNNPDPEIHKLWLQVPFAGERPTPEEFIPYVAALVGVEDLDLSQLN